MTTIRTLYQTLDLMLLGLALTERNRNGISLAVQRQMPLEIPPILGCATGKRRAQWKAERGRR